MSKIFDELEKLAAIDTQLVGLKKQINAGPKDLELQQQHLEVAKAARSEVHAAVRTCAANIDTLNMDVKTKEYELEDMEQKLSGVKNTKEYQIITGRIKDLKKGVSDNESRELELMEELDSLKAALEEKTAAADNEEKALAAKEQEIENDVLEIKSKQIELVSQRKAQIAIIEGQNPKVMKIYSDALKLGKGKALSELKNDACQACFRKATATSISLIRAHNDIEKCRCAGCGRILVIKETPENVG